MSDFDDDEGYDEYEDDFIDDEDDDDDDDEDYDGGKKKKSGKRKLKDAKSKKKQKKKKRSGLDFIQMEAEEDEEEENSDDDEISPEERKLAEQRRLQEQNKLKRRTEGPNVLNYDDEEELNNYLRSNQMNEVAEDTELGLLPTPADPKLFFVKCVPGEERDICYQIMKKYFDYLNTDAEFEIFSASCVEKIQGQIYIEAFTDKHVYMAIANIPKVFGKISLVNFADRTLIFEPDPRKNVQAKVDQWVRIKRGLYEGDLAQVTDIDELKGRVEVRLVPRLAAAADMEEEKDEDQEKELGEEEKKNKRMEHLAKMRAAARSKIKPPQKLFQENEYQCPTQRDVERGISFLIYQGNRYYEGLLYKWFPIKNLITENINVTYDESKFFTSGENTDPAMLSTLINQVGSKPTKFFKGDRVKVIKGDLMNLEAIIRNINQNSLTLEPVGTDFVEVLEIAPGDCVKAFPKGAYVRVVEGKNAGKEGFVLSVDDSNIATLMSDGLQNVIQVFVNDLVFCNEATRTIDVSTSKDKDQQDYVKFDLVKLNDRKTVGIILGTSNAGWKILDNFGNVRSVSVYQIEQKLNTRNNMTKNDKNQTLRINDSVTIRQGRYKGQTGMIKHIYNDLLFIYNPEVDQNNGAIIEKANNTYLLSSQRATAGKPSGPKVKDNLLGQKCVIKSGAWKGYQGLVKDATDKVVRLELTAKCKIIDVKRELVVPLSEVGKPTEAPQNPTTHEPKTPMINRFPQSPMFNNMASPGFETSPAWGGFESPAYNQHL